VLPVRNRIRNTIDQNLSGAPAGLLKGVLLGEKRGIPTEVSEAFTWAGVNHVLAVSGFHVGLIAAVDGKEALHVRKLQDVNLVITDCKMPNISGLEFMEAAREDDPELKFIVVSSTATEEDFKQLRPKAIHGQAIPIDRAERCCQLCTELEVHSTYE
tara:strand:- start:1389 stop:1859 length:471 start_codon:yes stop_codon:yes gene_type:complete